MLGILGRGCRAFQSATALGGTRLAAPVGLALSLALVAPAFADGGRGGGTGGGGTTGVSGGADSATGAGGDGSTGINDAGIASGGGGGGAGVTGGSGGDGFSSPAAGGAGGTTAGANGGDGSNASSGGTGGGGGGGGAHGAVVSTSGALSSVGGNGGNGGNGPPGPGGSGPVGGGGGGGGGGYGAVVTGSGLSLTNSGTVAGGKGGNGGDGGSGGGSPGDGGSGGIGLDLTGTSNSLVNTGTITGGAGGTSGVVRNANNWSHNGAAGLGGVGIRGAGLTIVNSGTISGGLSGDGVTRANAISFTGGINTLELQAGTDILGNVVAFSAADTLRLGGAANSSFDVSQIGASAQYQGFGIFQKTGSSTWTLTGTNTAAQSWTIDAGILSVNGTITSATMTVNAGGALGGAGTVGNTTIAGGVLAPGNSIGTITVAGDLVFGAGSTYSVEVSPVTADRTNVTGTANLSGGTVEVTYLPGTFVAKSYTILHADGGLGSTAFAGFDAPTLPGLTSSLVYDYTANNVYLQTTAEAIIGVGLNENQKSVDTALIDYFNQNGALPGAFAGLDANGLSQLSGEVAAGAVNAGIDSADQFINALDAQAVQGEAASSGGGTATAYAVDEAGGGKDRFAALGMKASHNADLVGSVFASRWQAWGAVYGGAQKIGGDAIVGSHDTNADIFGVAGGIVRNWGDSRLGVAIGGGSSSFSLSDDLGSGRADTFNVGVFGRQGFGDAYIAGVLAYGFNDTNTSRTVPGDTLEASFNAQTWSGRVEGGYRFATPVAVLTPYAAFQATAYRLPDYAETSAGSGDFALGYGSQTTTATRFELGLNLDKDIALQDGAKLTLSGRAAWAINGSTGRTVTATFQNLPGATFTIDGAEPDTNAALVNASATYTSGSGLFASLGFQGEFSGNVQSYAGKAKIGISW
ncbi:autotransporter outer membrane beta-barrel domain-containing protein [Mesorhizobium opportunistum]|uniref:Outer membrane autotransporter barrel domain protein n=1 Tax=Mesorhizobium opportunistum (strain LMG 24607 / HAMBI 3007 / WSM2075) TaxID=536019 RepID=F7YFG8_MESOW|nr:autotransporter domain-containing protein [Mesorhizobium opportunistum]AEH85713.1 outer membrane autotransporter barrel domain protein [Mesorhizobium opportunistum WSM2075]